MDAAGLIIGLPGLVQTCVHAYRFVGEMMALDETIIVLRLQYRIEESRLHLWGRFWGVLDDSTGNTVRSVTTDFDDHLGMQGANKLVFDVFRQIEGLLVKMQDVAKRYSSDVSSAEDGTVATTNASFKSLRKSKDRSTNKLRWALKDKTKFEETLRYLGALNDGLDKLLPKVERVNVSRALIGEVLAEEAMVPTDPQASNLSQALQEAKASRELGKSPQSPSHDRAIEGPQSARDVMRSDKLASTTADGTPSDDGNSMRLPLDWFRDLSAKGRERTVELMNGCVKATEPGQTSRDSPQSFAQEGVFVEWRSYEETLHHEQLQMALNARREQISKLFRRELGGDNSEHYVLSCLGYILPDDVTMGLVFRLPAGANGRFQTLNEVLEASYESLEAVNPDLDLRLTLATKLSIALYQLHCSGWLHRQISSHNIVFFETDGSQGSRAGLDLTRPYLAGWQTSRHDDQLRVETSEGSYAYRKYPYLKREYGYLHPARPKTRFKRSYDVYSLGVVLAEIAFWEPIGSLEGIRSNNLDAWERKWHELHSWSELVTSTCEKELGGECGRQYRSAVLWCLRGIREWQMEKLMSGVSESRSETDREVGLEKAFYWNVVQKLDKVSRALNG